VTRPGHDKAERGPGQLSRAAPRLKPSSTMATPVRRPVSRQMVSPSASDRRFPSWVVRRAWRRLRSTELAKFDQQGFSADGGAVRCAGCLGCLSEDRCSVVVVTIDEAAMDSCCAGNRGDAKIFTCRSQLIESLEDPLPSDGAVLSASFQPGRWTCRTCAALQARSVSGGVVPAFRDSRLAEPCEALWSPRPEQPGLRQSGPQWTVWCGVLARSSPADLLLRPAGPE
jgi:hypothetical protein